MIYGATGTLDINGVASAIVAGGTNRIILVFGLVFLVSAIAGTKQTSPNPRRLRVVPPATIALATPLMSSVPVAP